MEMRGDHTGRESEEEASDSTLPPPPDLLSGLPVGPAQPEGTGI